MPNLQPSQFNTSYTKTGNLGTEMLIIYFKQLEYTYYDCICITL